MESSQAEPTKILTERAVKGEPLYSVRTPELTKGKLLANLNSDLADAKPEIKSVIENKKMVLVDLLENVEKDKKGHALVSGLVDELTKITIGFNQQNEEGKAAIYEGYISYILLQESKNNEQKDPLTGMYNKRGLVETLEQIIIKSETVFGEDLKSLKNKKVTIIFSDIDNFGTYNKKFGHQTGDRVLSGYAGAFVGGIRDFDLAGRYGGEEFVAIAFGDVDPHIVDARIFGKVLEFNEELKEKDPWISEATEEGKLPVTFSAGGMQVKWSTLEALFNGQLTLDKEGKILKEKINDSAEMVPVIGEKKDLSDEQKMEIFGALIQEANNEMLNSKKEGKNTIRVAGSD